MKTLIFIFFLPFVVSSCGDNEGKNRCISREAKILECRALEAAANYYNTPAMLEAQKEKCEQTFMVDRCY